MEGSQLNLESRREYESTEEFLLIENAQQFQFRLKANPARKNIITSAFVVIFALSLEKDRPAEL
jgi:hypothetical protein